MFGCVRAASSTPEDLEMERLPSKLMKEDSLSIYETTLMKLKLGALRDVGPPPQVAMEIESDCDSTVIANSSSTGLSSRFSEADCKSYSLLKSSLHVKPQKELIMADTDCSSANTSPGSSNHQSICSMKQQQRKDVSVLYLFSKYRSSGQLVGSSQEEVMIEVDGSCLSNLTNSSDFQSLKSSKRATETELF